MSYTAAVVLPREDSRLWSEAFSVDDRRFVVDRIHAMVRDVGFDHIVALTDKRDLSRLSCFDRNAFANPVSPPVEIDWEQQAFVVVVPETGAAGRRPAVSQVCFIAGTFDSKAISMRTASVESQSLAATRVVRELLIDRAVAIRKGESGQLFLTARHLRNRVAILIDGPETEEAVRMFSEAPRLGVVCERPWRDCSNPVTDLVVNAITGVIVGQSDENEADVIRAQASTVGIPRVSRQGVAALRSVALSFGEDRFRELVIDPVAALHGLEVQSFARLPDAVCAVQAIADLRRLDVGSLDVKRQDRHAEESLNQKRDEAIMSHHVSDKRLGSKGVQSGDPQAMRGGKILNAKRGLSDRRMHDNDRGR